MASMVEEAIDMGADSICMNPVHSAGGYIDVSQIQVTDRNMFNDLRSKATEIASGKIGINILRDLPEPVLTELT